MMKSNQKNPFDLSLIELENELLTSDFHGIEYKRICLDIYVYKKQQETQKIKSPGIMYCFI